MSKVVRELKESLFISKYEKYSFFFSSEFNKSRYDEGVIGFTEKLERKFNTLYCIKVSLKTYAHFIYYSKIEKRGYYIEHFDGQVIECQNNITLDGVIKTITNSEKTLETLMQKSTE